jgi:hypothetical protein
MPKPKKKYKVTYKTYFNERLKKNYFHNKLMYPLYVQITFDRIPIIFKSYYYDLFSKSKYAIEVAGQVFIPDIKEIIAKEKTLIEFIIDKNLQAFSLAVFKEQYAFYSRDLVDILEEPFLDYLFTFLQDEGLPSLAIALKKGASDCILYNLVQDMKRALTPALYNKLIENSFYYAPPYLPLFAFTEKSKQTPMQCLTVMEWQKPQTKEDFSKFFHNYYPNNDIAEILQAIQKWAGKE